MKLSELKRVFILTGLGCFMECALASGCGGTQKIDVTELGPEEPAVPEYVVKRLTSCAERGAARLTSKSYAILFDVNVDEDGDVGSVRIKDSMIDDRGVESCMADVLEDMSLHTAMRSSRSEGVTAPQSRALIGNPLVLGGAAVVSLTPIVLVAAGVTIVVGITVYVVSTHAKDLDKDEECWERCKHLLPSPSGDLQSSEYRKCYRECKGTL